VFHKTIVDWLVVEKGRDIVVFNHNRRFLPNDYKNKVIFSGLLPLVKMRAGSQTAEKPAKHVFFMLFFEVAISSEVSKEKARSHRPSCSCDKPHSVTN